MIEADGLGRAWGGRRAVHGLSFRVGPGEVVGLLGPNGAGKSTTLRMLAGSLAASEGRARVGGHDLLDAPLAAKALVGFLPERPPVHPDMRVAAYLDYVAVLHGVRAPAAAVAVAVQRAGLEGAVGRRIGNLSKGFRQRVGVAAAIVHGPPALLLDEPTSGLDPAERVELRQVIRGLAAAGAAVVLSTHVLAEVEATCDRVLVLHDGRLVADLPRGEGWGASDDRLRLRVERPEGLEGAVRAVPGVEDAAWQDGALTLRVRGEVRAAVARVAAEHGLLELVQPRGLESLYLRLTGGEP